MRVLLIGPIPDPITGVSLINEIVIKVLGKSGVKTDVIDTSILKRVSASQGSDFSFFKALGFIRTYLPGYKILFCDAIYITPGQTFFGVLKYLPFMALAKLSGKKLIFHLHGNFLGYEYKRLKGFRKWFFRKVIRLSDKAIVLSESLKRNFKDILPSEKIYVLHNCVPDELMQFSSQSKGAPLRFLFLTNIIKEKGALVYLHALKKLKEENISFSAVLAGQMDEEIRTEVEALLRDLSPEVSYPGIVKGEKKLEVLQSSNIFVLPTWYWMEGQPVSILEAMAQGHYIITTRHAGIPDVVNEENGIFVKPDNVDSVYKVFKQLSQDPQILENVKEHNRKKAGEMFSEEKFRKGLVEILG